MKSKAHPNILFILDDQHHYDASYYETMPTTDPKGPAVGFSKVLRGGAFNYPATEGTATTGMSYVPDAELYQVGFRVVCETDK